LQSDRLDLAIIFELFIRQMINGESIFVVAAYDLPPRQLRASTTAATKTIMTKAKDPNRYPKGLNRRKVQALIDHYDGQSDALAIAKAEAAYRKRTTALVGVPVKLLPAVREMIVRKAG
jgi:hypothetical protein